MRRPAPNLQTTPLWLANKLQAKNVINHIGDVFRVSVPMFLYFALMWSATLVVTRKFHSTYEQCVTQV